MQLTDLIKKYINENNNFSFTFYQLNKKHNKIKLCNNCITLKILFKIPNIKKVHQLYILIK